MPAAQSGVGFGAEAYTRSTSQQPCNRYTGPPLKPQAQESKAPNPKNPETLNPQKPRNSCKGRHRTEPLLNTHSHRNVRSFPQPPASCHGPSSAQGVGTRAYIRWSGYFLNVAALIIIIIIIIGFRVLGFRQSGIRLFVICLR